MAGTLPIRKLLYGARSAVSLGGRTRLGRASGAFVRSVLASLTHAGHILWLQITGCFFALFALGCWTTTIRAYREYSGGTAPFGRVVLAGCLALSFSYFAFTSFLYARRKSNRP